MSDYITRNWNRHCDISDDLESLPAQYQEMAFTLAGIYFAADGMVTIDDALDSALNYLYGETRTGVIVTIDDFSGVITIPHSDKFGILSGRRHS
jgi:hypothetical protein